MASISDAAKMNMPEVNMKTFKDMVKRQFMLGMTDKPILCLGKSGIGKTEAIIQVAKDELKVGYVELRLVNYTETDLIGVPTPVKDEASGSLVTKWAQMGRLPLAERDGERGILVLDEVTSAASTVRAAAFQLMDASRSVGDYKLPDGWLIVALGNGPEDGGVYNGLEPAFLSRCLCCRVDPDVKAWKEWAYQERVHPSVIGFFDLQPDELWNLNLDAEYGGEIYPCPRTWKALSDILVKCEEMDGHALSDIMAMTYANASVGVRTGTMFAAFYKLQTDITPFEEIAAGKAKVNPKTQRNVMYLQSQAIVAGIRDAIAKGRLGNDPLAMQWNDETYTIVGNCMKYIIQLSEVVLDVAIAMMRDIALASNEFGVMVAMNPKEFDKHCPEFVEFMAKNNIVIQ